MTTCKFPSNLEFPELAYFNICYVQSNDADSFKKFPSKSCPLRYGTAKIKEDALSLFQAGLREYLGQYNVKTSGNKNCGWGITGLSVSASKIVAIPSVSSKLLVTIMYFFHPFPFTFLSYVQISME